MAEKVRMKHALMAPADLAWSPSAEPLSRGRGAVPSDPGHSATGGRWTRVHVAPSIRREASAHAEPGAAHMQRGRPERNL